ncbi:MAG: heme o synthase [Myxococcales bacterium]|nr:heme o synthase [Myxococcales bacterium]
MTTVAQRASFGATLSDLFSLTKPRITLLVAITAGGGMWLAPTKPSPVTALIMLLSTCMIVSGASTLNCYLERDSDKLMARTAKRPLPDGRLRPRAALWLGLGLGILSVPALTFFANPLTGVLGAIALISYVLVYTPLKPRTPTALLIGAIPGALPPLMGWTAATGQLDAPGLVLFGILFFWQIPHFIAISIFRQEEYERAGLKVLPSTHGLAAAKVYALCYTVFLVATSLLLFPLHVAGTIYLVGASLLGALFVVVALRGLREDAHIRWSKQLFFVSLIYLTGLFAVLMIDAA